MKLGGWQGVSLIDYPDKVCAVLFTQGCNFKCPYCHNPELVDPKRFQECLPQGDVLSLLQKRKGKLDAVSITGGEPTIQSDLVEFVERIKDIPYFVKIDTNGSHPEVLEKLVEKKLVDYIAMDVKAPLGKYNKVTKSRVKTEKIKESIALVKDSGVAYEFRTTVVKSLLTKSDLGKIGALIRSADLYVLQKFVPSKALEKRFLTETTYTDKDFQAIKEKVKDCALHVLVR
jgi:pyruvate formate lyase activating enzyme